MTQILGFLPPTSEASIEFWTPGFGLAICGHLGSRPVDGWCLSVSVFKKKVNQFVNIGGQRSTLKSLYCSQDDVIHTHPLTASVASLLPENWSHSWVYKAQHVQTLTLISFLHNVLCSQAVFKLPCYLFRLIFFCLPWLLFAWFMP